MRTSPSELRETDLVRIRRRGSLTGAEDLARPDRPEAGTGAEGVSVT